MADHAPRTVGSKWLRKPTRLRIATGLRDAACLRKIAAGVLATVVLAGSPTHAQDSANSSGAFWIEEAARQSKRFALPNQAQRIRRLMPRREFARPTIWHERPAFAERPPPQLRATPAVASLPSNINAGAPGALPASLPATPGEGAAPPDAAAPTIATPVPPAAPVTPATPVAPASQAPAMPAAAQPAAAQPAFAVGVVGDNLAQWLVAGLADAFPPGQGVTVLGRARDSSGLVRDDFYDWPKATRDLVNGTRLDALVVMIGSNDRQALRGATGTEEPLSPGWSALYGKRIETLVGIARDKKIPVLWVGLPIMKSERYSSDIGAINELDRTHAEAAGAHFIDVFDAFADEKGQYSAFGPDLNGQIVKLRTGDGIHFTMPGARKLAHFVEGDLRRLREASLPAPAPAIVLPPAEVPVVIAPPVDPATPAKPAAVPAPEAAREAAREIVPERPAVGPVLPLTASPTSPGGELLGRPGTARVTDTQRASVESLIARPSELFRGAAADRAR